MRFAVVLLCLTAGCKLVYDAQYDDRRGELEAFREDFLPATDRVQFFTSANTRLYWVSIEKPLDEPLLHSRVDGTRVEYEFTRGQNNIATNYRLSDELVVGCGDFSTAEAYDATASNQLIEMIDVNAQECAVDGRNVYLKISRVISRWQPGGGAPAPVVDLDAQGIGTDEATFGALGNLMLLEEGGRLWQIDLATGTATWLENEPVTSGSVFFDDRGVLYTTSQGVMYTQYDSHSSFLLDDAVADGGYTLGGDDYKDAYRASDTTEYVIHGDHVIYRGGRGIFAYGLETTKVVDLLLDDGVGFDATVVYRHPVVTSELTADGALYVQNDNGIGSDDHEVYRLSLSGRLR
jgi:hypothetical protein